MKYLTRYTPLNNGFFKNNRQKLAALLGPNSLAVLNSNDIMPTNGDGVQKFVQQSDLYYLAGVDQEETVLALYVNAEGELCEHLFIRETSPLIAVWEGEKLTLEEAAALSGISDVRWLDEMLGVMRRLMLQSEKVYLNDNEHLRADNCVETRDARFLKQYRQNFPLQQYCRLAPLLHGLRVIKQPEEIDMVRQAVTAAAHAFKRVLQTLKPGMYEFELEAEMTLALLQKRSRRHAFLPIIASGASACVLHYVENNRVCQNGDLVLLDYGAEYGNYNCDVSRTIPVNGRFSSRQRQAYNAVKAIHDFAAEQLAPGVKFDAYNDAVREFAVRQICGLGLGGKDDLVTKESRRLLAHKYMPHGVSHFLGLDVHDVGAMQGEIKAGMLLTCEPGLYIREEGLGIRLESDILVTATGPENLTGEIPMEADEIESGMVA